MTESNVIPSSIVRYLRSLCSTYKPLHKLFQEGELLEITKGLFKSLQDPSQKLETSPSGMSRVLLLVKILESFQKNFSKSYSFEKI